MLYPQKEVLAFLDLGCAGGGMVLDAALRGHIATGLEGSDLSLQHQRAEWRLLRNNLFTCDITKPFRIENNGATFQYDVVTMWDVLEHIPEDSLPTLLENIRTHLLDGGLFVASISTLGYSGDVDWHVTKYPRAWWAEKITDAGFDLYDDLLDNHDMARGFINPSYIYARLTITHKETCFFIVCKKRITPISGESV